MLKNPVLYRKRIIPEECVLLKDDIILHCNDDIIVTKWNALKPKKDLHHGYSCYFLKEGYKVSKFFHEDDTLMCYYCDIIKYEYNDSDNKLVVTDLLADVIIYPDGLVKVVDINEFIPALESGGLSLEDLKIALINLDNLLRIIYAGDLKELLKYINEFS